MIKKYASDEEFRAAYEMGFADVMKKNAQFFSTLGKIVSPIVSLGARGIGKLLGQTDLGRGAMSFSRRLTGLSKGRTALQNQLAAHKLVRKLGGKDVAHGNVTFKPGKSDGKWKVQSFLKDPSKGKIIRRTVEADIPWEKLPEAVREAKIMGGPEFKEMVIRLTHDPAKLKKYLEAIENKKIYNTVGKWTAGIGGGAALTGAGALALSGGEKPNPEIEQQMLDDIMSGRYDAYMQSARARMR